MTGSGGEDFDARYGPWVIAGAPEGIGAELADQLAARGLDLVFARNGALLDQVAAAARDRYGVQVRTLVQDLTVPDVATKVAAATDGFDVACWPR